MFSHKNTGKISKKSTAKVGKFGSVVSQTEWKYRRQLLSGVSVIALAAIVGLPIYILVTRAASGVNTLTSANCGSSPTADARTRNAIYNVSSYGATGNGSTNDTISVQNAIDAAKAAGGGTVWFPQGVYQVRNVQIFAGITYSGTNATIQHIAGYGKDDQIFRTPKNANYYNSPQVYNGYNGSVESPPLVVKCLVFDGNRPDGSAYWGHQLEHAHLLYLTSEQPSVGRLRSYVEDAIFMNGTADGISVGTGVYATINRILMKDVFRGGFVVTGDNNKVDVNSFRYIQSTGHDDSMDIEVDDPAVNGRGLNEINIYNSDLDRTLDVDMGFVYYSQSYGSGTVSSVDSRTIFRLNNVSIAKSPFDLNMPNSNFCALHTTTHMGKVNDGNQVGRVYFGNAIEFKDSNIILSDDNPVDDTNGPIRVGFHPTVEGFGFANQQIRFEGVHFSKDASASIVANVLDVTGRRASDKIAIINSTIDASIPNPVVSSDGSSTAYSTTAAAVPAKCDWSTAPSFPNQIAQVPVLNGIAATYNSTFDRNYAVSGNPTPAPTAAPTPVPTPASTATTATAGNTIDDNNAAFAYSGTWEYYPPGTEGTLYQGGNHTSNVTNAATKLTFNGGGVKLYGTKDTNYGKARVVIDGNTAGATDIDLYQSSRGVQQLIYERSDLAAGSHTMTLTVLGTKNASATNTYVVVDKADILASTVVAPTPAPTPTPVVLPPATQTVAQAGTLDDNHSSFAYVGAWEYYAPGTEGTLYQGGNHTSNVTNASFSQSFNGGGVKLYGTKDTNYGKARVVIDGNTAGATDIDLYQSSRGVQQLIYEKIGLTDGNHMVVVTILATKNSASSGNYVVIDKAEVLAATVTAGGVVIPPAPPITQVSPITQGNPNPAPAPVTGQVSISPISSDPTKKIAKVEYFADGKKISTDTKAPYSLDTTLLSNGKKTITEKVTYSDGSIKEAKALIKVENKQNALSPVTRFVRLNKQPITLSGIGVGGLSAIGGGYLIFKKQRKLHLLNSFKGL